ncbi:MAG TPA: hypothetical protein VD928_03900 [Candidatus Paceibacterota bacterium]|nr:hypothetical protein [Candidatus Paceibacterota bacterium]
MTQKLLCAVCALIFILLVGNKDVRAATVPWQALKISVPTIVLEVAAKKKNKKKAVKATKKKKKARKVAKKRNYNKSPPTAELCLTWNVIGEAAREPFLGKWIAASAPMNYAARVGRTICDEIKSGRYSWWLSKKSRARVLNSPKKVVDENREIVRAVMKSPKPPHPSVPCITSWNRKDWKYTTPNGRRWLELHTIELGLVIGEHEFRMELPKAKVVRVSGAIVPIPTPRPPPGIVPPECKPPTDAVVASSGPVPRMVPTLQ